MRRSQTVRSISFLLLFVGVAAVSLHGQARQPETTSPAIIISVPESTVEAGSDIPLNITLTNVAQAPLRVMLSPEGKAEVCYEVSVTDSQGHPAEKTDYYQKTYEGLPSRGKFTVVMPGRVLDEDLLLNKLYDLSRPDLYTVRVTRFGMILPSNAIPSNSNSISLTVVPAGAAGTSSKTSMPERPAFAIDISGDDYIVHAGTPITFQVRLTNLSDHQIVVPQEARKQGEFDFTVRVVFEPERQEAPKTAYGWSLDEVRASMPASAWNLITLAPGKSFVENITLTDLYDLSKPGVYVIDVERRDETVKIKRLQVVEAGASFSVGKAERRSSCTRSHS